MFLRLRSAAWCYMQGCLQRANYCIAQWKGRLQPVFAAVPFKLGSSCPTSMRLLWERWFLPFWTRQILNLAKWRSGPYYWSCSLPWQPDMLPFAPLFWAAGLTWLGVVMKLWFPYVFPLMLDVFTKEMPWDPVTAKEFLFSFWLKQAKMKDHSMMKVSVSHHYVASSSSSSSSSCSSSSSSSSLSSSSSSSPPSPLSSASASSPSSSWMQ